MSGGPGDGSGAHDEALFVSCADDLVFAQDRRFRRLYYGNEVCSHLLPEPAELREVRRWATQGGLAFTFVTPPVTNLALPALEASLAQLEAGDEVVCNDLGVLRMLRGSPFEPVVGRQLVKGTRDPRVTDSDLALSGVGTFLRSSLLGDPDTLALFRECGARRVELDNRRGGWDLALDGGWRSSLHHPFVLVSTTRRCQQVFGAALPPPGTCHALCRTGQVEYGVQRWRAEGPLRVALFWQGAGHWAVNPELPGDTRGWNLDRLVYQPHPPARATLLDPSAAGDWNRLYADPEAPRPWDPGRPSPIFDAFRSRLGPPKEGAALLDVGCGGGRNLGGPLAEGWRVTGLDLSEHAIRAARARHPRADFVAADLRRAEVPGGPFAVVQDYSCFHCVPPEDRRAWIDRVEQALEDGGHYLLACWAVSPEPGGFSLVVLGSVVEWGIRPSELRQLVGDRFDLVAAEVLADAEPLPLGHYALRKRGSAGSVPSIPWPADPPDARRFPDEGGAWVRPAGYEYWVEERYLADLSSAGPRR